MSENKKNQEQKAKEFFADKKNSNINTVYTTSDGWLFRAAHYANNWVKDNPKVTIEVHHRNPSKGLVEVLSEVANRLKGDQESGLDAETETTSTVREVLVKEYIELFDTKPHHMFSDEKVTRLIEEKKAELAASKKQDEGSEGIEELGGKSESDEESEDLKNTEGDSSEQIEQE